MPEVPYHGVLHRFIGEVDDGGVPRSSTSVRDQDVDSAEVIDCAIDDCFTRLALLHVTSDVVRSITCIKFGECAFRFTFVTTVDDHHGPFVEKPFGDAETNASGTSSNAGNAPVKYSHEHPLVCARSDGIAFRQADGSQKSPIGQFFSPWKMFHDGDELDRAVSVSCEALPTTRRASRS